MTQATREPGFWETLAADIEWSAGPVEGVDDKDPEGWRARGFKLGNLASCLQRPGFAATVLYRVARYCKTHGHPLLSGGLMLANQTLTGAELSHNADIGPGLRILHPMGVYVGPHVHIGIRSTINQGASVQKNLNEGSGNPDCGNYLQLSPGARILGKVEIGDRVWVGPNSVVVDDVPDDTTVFGIPAKKLGTEPMP